MSKQMLHIVFEYRDEMSDWQWQEQECIVSSLAECIALYGLGIDCEYKVISITPVERDNGS